MLQRLIDLRYSFIYSYPQYWMVQIGQLYAPAALMPGKE